MTENLVTRLAMARSITARGMAATLALLCVLSLTMTLSSARVYAASPANSAGVADGNGGGDIHDDRPDDADSAGPAGGDQSTATTSISAAARTWANANGFDLAAFEDYVAPAAHTPTTADIAAFENWMSGGSNPRNQVMQQARAAAGETIADELWNYCNTIWKGWMNTANVGSVVSKTSGLKNVGAMQEGMFAGYFGAALGGGASGSGDDGGNRNNQDGYDNAALLVKDGFVVSSDGVTYRLHNMIDGTVAYEIAAPESAVVSEDEFPQGLTSFTDFLPLEKQAATTEAKALLKQYALARSTGDTVNTDNTGNIANHSEPTNVDRTVYQAAEQYVNDKFGEYYGQCPGPTAVKGITAQGISLDAATEDTVGSSVGEKEFVASFFGAESAAADLWRLGFLPSFDGTTYRLHSGKEGTVVYEISAADMLASSDTASTAPTQIPWLPLGVAGVIALAAVGTYLFVFRRKQKS